MTKWPPVGHHRSNLEKKMICLCSISFVICVPSLNKIGKCMSKKWLRTWSTPGFCGGFFTTKMATSAILDLIWKKKMMCICIPSCVVFVPSTHKISPYISEIWLRTHTCTHARTYGHKNRDQIQMPPFQTKFNWGLIMVLVLIPEVCHYLHPPTHRPLFASCH